VGVKIIVTGEKKGPPLFWGWWVVMGAFLVLAVNYGARYCFGVFLKPMAEDYGWSRSVISLGASLNMLVYSLGAVVMGRLVDRTAPRWIITTGALIAALSFVLTAFVKTPLAFYLVYGLMCGTGTAGMGVVVANSSVGKWFVRKRGTALGITTMGIGFGTIVLTPAAGYIVEHLGWRVGFLFLGAVVFIVGVTLSQILLGKKSPEDHGLAPDGGTTSTPPLSCEAPAVDERPSFSAVLKDSRFRVLAMGFGAGVMVMMSVFIHQVAFAVDRGIDRVAAASSLGATAMSGLAGQFFFGWLSDRLRDPKYAASLGMGIMALGMVFLIRAEDVLDLYLYALVFGFGYGSLAPMMPILLADRFGRQVMGTVYGYVTLFIGGGGAVGPILAGLFYDRLGSYDIVWLGDAAVLLAAGILLLNLRRTEEGPRGERRSAAPGP